MFMARVLGFLSSLLTPIFRSRLSLQLEIAALRHQLSTYRLQAQRPGIEAADRLALVDHSTAVVAAPQGAVFRPATDDHTVAAEAVSGLLAGTESK